MIDLVCEFGVEVLRPEQKTPTLQYYLYCEREKIHDHREYRTRRAESEMTEDRIRSLIYSMTGSHLEADKAASYLILKQAKQKQQQSSEK